MKRIQLGVMLSSIFFTAAGTLLPAYAVEEPVPVPADQADVYEAAAEEDENTEAPVAAPYTGAENIPGDAAVIAGPESRIPDTQGKWVKNQDGSWSYRDAAGSYLKDVIASIEGKICYFNPKGIFVSGLITYKGDTNFPAGKYFFGSDGTLQTGWVKIDGVWHYFNEDGTQRTGWLFDDGYWYFLNDDGTLRSGWIQSGNEWFWLTRGTGEMLTSRWAQINGDWYYFTSSGAMKKGWLQTPADGKWYYLTSLGSMKTGWLRAADGYRWHYLLPSTGEMAVNQWVKSGDGWYFMDQDGMNTFGPVSMPDGMQPGKNSIVLSDPLVVSGVEVVNKKYGLLESYAPGENQSAAIQLRAMIRQMKAEGLDISDSYSGYRSYATQKQMYDTYVARDGQAKADTYSARPGFSEHQTGLAFDIKHSDGTLLSRNPEVAWVANNAWRYGFIVRYPAGKQSITGYQYEPWHLRFVGSANLAADITNSGLCLEEYLGIQGGNYN